MWAASGGRGSRSRWPQGWSVDEDTAWWNEVERNIELGVSGAEPERFALHEIAATFTYGGDEVSDGEQTEGVNAKRARSSQPEADAEDEWWLEVERPPGRAAG